jgi:hypothetical protein
MKRVYFFAVVSLMLMTILSSSWAAIKLNSSKSNIYRMVWPEGLVSQDQATAMLAELDKRGPSDEATLKRWLAANFKRFGIQATRVKKISILLEQQVSCSASVETCKGKWVGPALNARTGPNAVCFCYGSVTSPTQVAKVNKASPIRILLLTELDQEAPALAVSEPGVPANKSN